MNKKKWMKVLTLFCYIVAVICYVAYIMKKEMVFMMAGAAFMCWGSVCLVSTAKKDKE